MLTLSNPTLWPLFALILPLLLSVIPSLTIIPTSIQVMASASVGNQGEDDNDDEESTRDEEDDGDNNNDDNDDDIDIDELNLLQICCAWSDKISDGVLEHRISDEGDDDSKQAVRNAIEDWDVLIDNLIFVEKQDDSAADVDSLIAMKMQMTRNLIMEIQ